MFYRWQDQSLLLFCYLQPKASSDEFAGLHGERLKIRLKAAPIDGRANDALLQFIASQFGVAKRDVSILSGASNRRKTVAVNHPRKLPERLAIERQG